MLLACIVGRDAFWGAMRGSLVNPDSYIFSETAGQIFGAGDMRQMQFGLHLRF